jgi:hypothetical protein
MAKTRFVLLAGAALLPDAVFHFHARAEEPAVKYGVTGSRGYLTVRQPPFHSIGPRVGQNSWDLHLDDRVPLDLRVHLGAGNGTLKLNGMAVRLLEVEMGAGELKLDLSAPWDKDLEAHVRGGIGGITARGLREHEGYYVNDVLDKPGVRLRIDISGGIGHIHLIG